MEFKFYLLSKLILRSKGKTTKGMLKAVVDKDLK